MAKEAVFTMKLEPELRDAFMAAAKGRSSGVADRARVHERYVASRESRVCRVPPAQGRSGAASHCRRPRHTHEEVGPNGASCSRNCERKGREAMREGSYGRTKLKRDARRSLPTSRLTIPLPQRMDALFEAAAIRLADFPSDRARRASLPDTRELIPHPSYRMVYEVTRRASMDHFASSTPRANGRRSRTTTPEWPSDRISCSPRSKASSPRPCWR